MKQLLLIQKNSPLKDYIELYLKGHEDVIINHVETLTDAFIQLNEVFLYDCIFIGHSIITDGDPKELTEIIKKYISVNKSCKVIGSNKGLSTLDWVIYIHSMSSPSKIFETIRLGLHLPENVTSQAFAPIPFLSLNYFLEAPCDIYFKIGSDKEATFVKRFKAQDPLEDGEIEKYIQKDIKQVYITPEHFQRISETISSLLTNRSNASDSRELQAEVINEAIDYASHLLNGLGIEAKSEIHVQNIMNVILSSLERMDKKSSKKYYDILKTKEDFYHKHVSLTAILATSILDELNWENADEVRTSIIYAAFFHNFIINNERDIVCIDEATLSKIEPAERKEKVKNHANLTLDYIKDLKGLSYDAQKMILEQHGSLQGTGFPVGKNNSSQLSSLFMIANEFALAILLNLESTTERNIQSLLKKSFISYGKHNMKILEALRNCLIQS